MTQIGIRYKFTEQEIRNQLIEEMKAEEERDRQLEEGDPETRYLTEAKEKYVVPGFVHQSPTPTAVNFLS